MVTSTVHACRAIGRSLVDRILRIVSRPVPQAIVSTCPSRASMRSSPGPALSASRPGLLGGRHRRGRPRAGRRRADRRAVGAAEAAQLVGPGRSAEDVGAVVPIRTAGEASETRRGRRESIAGRAAGLQTSLTHGSGRPLGGGKRVGRFQRRAVAGARRSRCIGTPHGHSCRPSRDRTPRARQGPTRATVANRRRGPPVGRRPQARAPAAWLHERYCATHCGVVRFHAGRSAALRHHRVRREAGRGRRERLSRVPVLAQARGHVVAARPEFAPTTEPEAAPCRRAGRGCSR